MRNCNQHSPNARIPSILGGNILGSAATSPTCRQGRSSRAIYANCDMPRACRRRSLRTVPTLTATMLACSKASSTPRPSTCWTSWLKRWTSGSKNSSVVHREPTGLPISEIVRYFDKTAYRSDQCAQAAARNSGRIALKTGINHKMSSLEHKAGIFFDSFCGRAQ